MVEEPSNSLALQFRFMDMVHHTEDSLATKPEKDIEDSLATKPEKDTRSFTQTQKKYHNTADNNRLWFDAIPIMEEVDMCLMCV